MTKNKNVAAPQTVNNTVAETTTAVTNKAMDICPKLISVLGKASVIDDLNVITAYVLTYFIKLAAKNYSPYFNDEKVTAFTSIGVNYESRFLTTYDAEGTPLNTVADDGEYNLPELLEAYNQMTGESYDYDYIFDSITDLLYDCNLCEEDEQVRNSTIKILEDYMTSTWNVKEVKLTFDLGYVKMEVTR